MSEVILDVFCINLTAYSSTNLPNSLHRSCKEF